MKSGHILSAHANSPNHLKVVNKIAVSKLNRGSRRWRQDECFVCDINTKKKLMAAISTLCDYFSITNFILNSSALSSM